MSSSSMSSSSMSSSSMSSSSDSATSTVLVTGANRGLGLALAQVLAARGFRVFAGTRGSAGAGVSAWDGAGASPPTWLSLDVCDSASLERAAAQVRDAAGGLDVLINNAAVNPRPDCDAPLGDLDFEAIRYTYDVNAIGPLRTTQAFLPLLERGARKLVVNVSSEAGSLQNSWRDRTYGYCMSKAALNMQTTILDRALAPRGFNVIAVHPGWMRTDMGGPQAALDPRESAEGLYEIVMRANRDTARFLQHDGKEFPW